MSDYPPTPAPGSSAGTAINDKGNALPFPLLSSPLKTSQHKGGRPKGRLNNKTLKARAKPIAEVIAAHLLTDKPVLGVAKIANGPLSKSAREEIVRVIGNDPEAFRAALADQLLITGAELIAAIRRDVDIMKPESRAYSLAVVVDKAEQLRARLASTPKSAQVNVQINSWGPQSVDRGAILAALNGDVNALMTAANTPQPRTPSPALPFDSASLPVDVTTVSPAS